MKANYKKSKDGFIGKKKYVFTEEQLEAYLNEEWKRKEENLYKLACKDAAAQILAVLFTTLYMPPYNWRSKRLRAIKEAMSDVFRAMQTGVLGKHFSTIECVEFCKREFGIDMDKELEKILTEEKEDAK